MSSRARSKVSNSLALCWDESAEASGDTQHKVFQTFPPKRLCDLYKVTQNGDKHPGSLLPRVMESGSKKD